MDVGWLPIFSLLLDVNFELMRFFSLEDVAVDGELEGEEPPPNNFFGEVIWKGIVNMK